MLLNRRAFLVSASAIAVARPLLSTAAQQPVTSGGIGLTLADVQSIYEELPVGQSFRNFAEPETGTTLYIDFGDTDLAQTIWVSGEFDEEDATFLMGLLCPDDVTMEHAFEFLDPSGSPVFRKTVLWDSSFLAELDAARSRILATYVVEPPMGSDSGVVRGFTLSVEQAGDRTPA